MKKSSIFIFLAGCTLSVFAQAAPETIGVTQVDMLTKIVGLLMALGGIYLGYSSSRTATKLAELEVKFTKELQREVERIETKIDLSHKGLAVEMATKRDLDNFNKLIQLQFEIINQKLKNAEDNYKKNHD